MFALIRIPLLLVGFIVVNLALLVVCLARPFHRDNVAIAGAWYSALSRLLGLRLTLRGQAHVDSNENYIVIGNHQNDFDIFTISQASFAGVTTVGKKSLKWIPIFGQIYYLTGNILIDRENKEKARGTLDIVADTITQTKRSVWFFPEGTRSYGRGLLPFKTGAFRVAQKTQCKVLMVCASETTVKWNKINNGEVLIEYYPPVLIDDSKSVKEWTEYFHDLMKTRLAKLNQEVAERANHSGANS